MLASTFHVTSILSSDYGPLEHIGGPDSEVYRGRGDDGRDVALRFSTVHGDRARAELIETAQLATLVQHPMLAAVGGCQSFSGGALCIVSEYVPGETLDAWVAEHGLPSLRVAVDFVRRLCFGVHAAHQRGLTHPALHPGNLMVQPGTQPDGRIAAKLLDLGTPGFVHDWPPRAEALAFVAPELLTTLEHTARPITRAMNVYSCGALLHYLCTGEVPLLGTAGAGGLPLLAADGEPLPAELSQLLTRALAFDPARRTASAAELAAALGQLESVLRISGVFLRDPGPPEAPVARRSGPPPLPNAAPRADRPAIASSQTMPRVAEPDPSAAPRRPSIDRVTPRVAPPPTGSFPLAKIKPVRRWAIGTSLACLLALYAAWAWIATDVPAEHPRERAFALPVPTAPPEPSLSPAHTVPAAKLEPAIAPNQPIRGQPVPPELRPTELRTLRTTAPKAAPERVARRRPREPEPAPQTGLALPPELSATEAHEAALEPLPPAAPAPTTAPIAEAARSAPIPISNPTSIETETEARKASKPKVATPAPTKREARIADVSARGSLAVSVIRRAIERIRPLLTQCYQRHVPPNSAAPPSVFVFATIDEVGRVRSPSVQGGALPALSACVVKATSKMVTEAPDTGTVKVRWTLGF